MNGYVTKILNAMEQGDPNAADDLFPVVYDELRRLASRKMTHEKSGHTLQPTALVHEAFLRLVGNEDVHSWEGRGHFFAAAAEAMRRILIDNARRRKAQKRGGEWNRQALSQEDAVLDADDHETLLSLDEALIKLAEEDQGLAKLVQLRYFTGMTVDQTAELLGISSRTVKRNWAYARAWLRREMDGDA